MKKLKKDLRQRSGAKRPAADAQSQPSRVGMFVFQEELSRQQLKKPLLRVAGQDLCRADFFAG